MTEDEKRQLLARLAQSEDAWVERKQAYKEREARKTVVAFANSLTEGQTAFLFIGADNNGQPKGVENADKVQLKILSELEKCYPPIKCQMGILIVPVDGKDRELVWISVPFSKNRPHFSGPAYIRQGSKTVAASEDMFRELVASQNDKARRILQFKNKKAWVILRSKSGFWRDFECTVRTCDAISVNVTDNESRLWAFPLEAIQIQQSAMRDLEIIASANTTEEEHIRDIIERWARWRPAPSRNEYDLQPDWLVRQMLANPRAALSAAASLTSTNDNLWLRLLFLKLRFAVKSIDSPIPRPQKIRRLESGFARLMRGSSLASNSNLISAAVSIVAELASSLTEAEEFLKRFMESDSRFAKVGFETLWNALLWDLKL